MRGPRHLGALPGWLGHRQPPPRGLLPGASQGQRAALSHAITSPRCIGAPGERFSSHFSPVLPSSPGAGRCHPTVSSNPSRTDHALFLTPREEHVKGWSSTETEARSCQPRLTPGAVAGEGGGLLPSASRTRNYNCTTGRCSGEAGVSGGHGLSSGQSLNEQHRIRPLNDYLLQISLQPPRKPRVLQLSNE